MEWPVGWPLERSQVEPLRKGDVIEGHRILGELGRGAASIIYLAQDEKSKQISALKHVKRENPKDQRFLEQAEYEYKVSSKLDHPNIRKIKRLIKRKHLLQVKELFLVMELVDGLAMDQSPPKTFDKALSVFQQVADALSHMHERGFVHADMKPNNVVVSPEGVVKIIDLGQSCATGTIKPRIQGTPDYIAPEQVHRRAITPKTDIYNLGATMYAILTGKRVPTALADENSLLGSLDDSMIEKPRPAIELNERIHPKLNELVMQCVEIDPGRRPESMAYVADRLNLIQGIVRAEAERSAV
ncbi:MAG: serine/threonine protein kinase [Phycisphaeraceae bacterium]|nr:serine/threonine protein kinase [Phycisphaeraceae bacterium]